MDVVIEVLTSLISLEGLLLAVNALLLIFSRGIIEHINRISNKPNDGKLAAQLRAFRMANVVLILFVFFFRVLLPVTSGTYTKQSLWVSKALGIFLIGYLANLLFHLAAWLIKKRFGKVRTVGGEEQLVDTYNSRALELLAGFFISVIALISVIRILGFESLLEAGGVIGFMGVILALTQASWAPDIISGLIILNSNFIEEGDVIEVEDPRLTCTVFKTKMFHTELLDLRNNHRIMMRNAQLRNYVIHNLSKFASARGLREALRFQIGYDADPKKVRALFEEAFERANSDTGVNVEGKFGVEIVIEETGADAVEWGVYFYTRDVRNIIHTRHAFRQIIYATSIEKDICLGTPRLHILEHAETVSMAPRRPGPRAVEEPDAKAASA